MELSLEEIAEIAPQLLEKKEQEVADLLLSISKQLNPKDPKELKVMTTQIIDAAMIEFLNELREETPELMAQLVPGENPPSPPSENQPH